MSPAIRSTSTRTRFANSPRTPSKPFRSLEKGAEVKICGILTGIQRKRNKEGKPWAAMLLEDTTGSVDAMVFASQYERLQTDA